MLFCDLPDEVRMGIRYAVENAGGAVDGYYGECIQVMMPNPPMPFRRAMAAIGLDVETSFTFPAQTGSPVDHLRHDGSYPGSRGFNLLANLKPDMGRLALPEIRKIF